MTIILDSQHSGTDGVIETQIYAAADVAMVRGAVVGSTITYTLALTKQPTSDVVIGLVAGGTTGHSVSPSSLTFTSANWATPQTVTVTITNAGSQTDLSVITHSVTSSDPEYDRLVIDEFAPLWTWRTYIPATEQHANSSANITAVRASAIDWVWDGAGFPTRMPDSVTQNVTISSTYYDQSATSNISRVDELVVNITSGATTWSSKIWHFIPSTRVGRLAVVHQGHSDDLKLNGIGDMIKRLVETGYDVIGIHMPGKGPNTPSLFSDHNQFNSYETLSFNPVRVFLEPIAVAINHAVANNTYKQVSMVGISGGGWSTLFYSAIDTRITRSYPIAGAMPIGLRAQANDYGDYEQGVGAGPAAFYADICSYVDLYILASSGAGRRCVEIHNIKDSCCFGEYSDQAYTPFVKAQVASIGSGGEYRFWRDRSVINQHTISSYARDVVMSSLSVLYVPLSRLKVWDGSNWVTKVVKVWNGSSWVVKPLKVNTASGFVV